MGLLALIPLRVWLYAGVGLTALISLGVAIKHFEDVGARKAQDAIHQQAEKDRAEGFSGAHDARACADAGGVWSLARGTCVEP